MVHIIYFCIFIIFFYIQTILELDADEKANEYIYIDEAAFNLNTRRRRGRNVIGQRATVDVPAGLRGGNITMCAAISRNGVQAHNARLGPYNSERLIEFLDGLYDTLVPNEDTHYIIVWDNVRFHHSVAVREWFEAHARCTMVFLPPYSPFLNPIEELFSSWRWKVYDRRPYERVTLLQAMEEACEDIQDPACQAWIRHARRFFPRCLARENVRCDVDEKLWPERNDRHDNP